MPVVYMNKDFHGVLLENAVDFAVSQIDERVNDYIVRHKLTYRNQGAECRIIPVFESVISDEVQFYMIPCVNYNGNEWGTCQEPKGMECGGKTWIFPADRVGVPGCSIVQTKDCCNAVFADPGNASASVFRSGDQTIQRIYFSHIEYPGAYLRKYVYGEPIMEYVHFDAGEEKSFICYTYCCQKKEDSLYGYSKLFDYLNCAYILPYAQRYMPQQVKNLNYQFIESVTEYKNGSYISNMGFLPGGEHRLGDPNSTFNNRKGGNYEIGWCGQNVTVAEMYIRRYLETKNPKDLTVGTGVLDTWLKRQYPNGLISINMNEPFGDEKNIDTCNLGWFVWKGVWCCQLLKKAGVETSVYEVAVQRVCDCILQRYPEKGFPQILDCNAEVVCLDGCAGTMLMTGYLYAYEYFEDCAYLDRAKDAFDYYYNTYLRNSIAAGGALDTYCIDKESAGPVLRAALMLYEITKEDTYLEKAENIAHYLMTWCFYHDVSFDINSDCGQLGVKTTGGTAVSTAHHHLDCWGAYYVPDMVKLYRVTGNQAYLHQAQILWNFTTQYISDGSLILHGMRRMAGAQNEAVIQCNWHAEDEEKGILNDWLIIWVKTFQLDAYYGLHLDEAEGEK